MMPMEDIPSPRTAGESDSEESSSQDVPDIKKKNNNRQETSNNETSWNLCCCTGGSNQGISRNKIQPVIFQPNNDLYLQLKPHRRIRVIHINGQGAMPTPTPYYLQSSGDSDDDEEYWFQNADPKRPKITQPPPAKNLPKRIFHKLEPQVRPTLEQLSPSSLLNNSIQGRLPRKTIAKDAGLNNDDDIDEEDILEKPVVRSSENSPASLKRNNINIKSGQPDLHGVITLPEPGESSTDHNDEIDGANPDDPDHPGDKDAESDNESAQSDSNVTATIEEAGQKLGGMANFAFESEEAPEEEEVSTNPTKINIANDANETTTNNQESNNQTQAQPLYILPALFFIHGVGGSANIWSNQLSYFADLGHEVIAPDLLGHGFSSAPDKPKSYTFKKLLHDTQTIFDHFIPRNRECIVIGHSYGCSMAAALTRSRPESVKLLVMSSSGGPTPLCPPNQLSKIPPSLLACIKPFLKCRFGSSRKYKARGKAAKIQQVFDIPAYVLHHVMMGQLWPEGDASFHRKLGVPTLLVYGMKDPLVSLVEMCEMERTIPKAYLELIPMAGHMLMQDQFEELNIMLKKFIARYCSPSL